MTTRMMTWPLKMEVAAAQYHVSRRSYPMFGAGCLYGASISRIPLSFGNRSSSICMNAMEAGGVRIFSTPTPVSIQGRTFRTGLSNALEGYSTMPAASHPSHDRMAFMFFSTRSSPNKKVSSSSARKGSSTFSRSGRSAGPARGERTALSSSAFSSFRRTIHPNHPRRRSASAPPSSASRLHLHGRFQEQSPSSRSGRVAEVTPSRTKKGSPKQQQIQELLESSWTWQQKKKNQQQQRPTTRLQARQKADHGGDEASTRKKGQGKKSTESMHFASDKLFRADRVLANRSGKSRSESFQLLLQRRVWQVISDDAAEDWNDFQFHSSGSQPSKAPAPEALRIVPGPSAKLDMMADLYIDRIHRVPMPPPLLMAFHKPKWVLSVRSDPQGRPCLPTDQVLPDFHPVGRLDYDSSGLLLFSSSGTLTQTLLHPKHGIEKEYQAVVVGPILDGGERLRQQLAQGVSTADGVYSAELLAAEPMPDDQVTSYLQGIRQKLPPEYDPTELQSKGCLQVLDDTQTRHLATVRLVVQEGKYRMVRRMLANCGHAVVSLTRVRIGQVHLGGLPAGTWRPLTVLETTWARGLISGKPLSKSSPTRQRRDQEEMYMYETDEEEAEDA